MKQAKKVISLLLCLVMAFSCAATCLGSAANDENPVIYVTGMNTIPLYLDRGTENQTRVWPPQSDAIVDAVVASLPALIRVAFDKNWDAACDSLVPKVNDILGVIALNEDGTSKYNVSCGEYSESYEYYTENTNDEFFYAAREYAGATAEEIGGDKVFVFVYDWRMPETENARKLAVLVDKVKADTGYDKVTLAAISMGGAVTMAYLEMFGCDSVANTVMLSSAFCGLEIVGDLYSGRVTFDLAQLLNKIVDGAETNASADALTLLCSLLKAGGLVKVLGSLCDKVIKNSKDRIFNECMIPSFGSLGGMWGLVPNHDYAAAKAFMFGNNANTPMMDEADYYQNNVSAKSKELLTACMEKGMMLSVLSNYDKQIVPFGDEALNTSDGVIETTQTSGGATCALLGETLTDEQLAVKAPCGHNHASPDKVINAATAMFPEQTWFVRGMAHTEFRSIGNTNIFINWLITADSQRTVFDSEDYPQFMVIDRETKMISPIKGEISKYYFIDDLKAIFA